MPTRLHPAIARLVLLSRLEYFLDFAITPPITAFLVAHSLAATASWTWPLVFAAGWVAWTLYEYALHRVGLHGLAVLRDVHALHHARPKAWAAVHPAITVAIYAASWALFGPGSSAFACGFSVGYCWYALVHTGLHHAPVLTARWMPRLAAHHDEHHRFSRLCFGVTTTAWDRLFRTANR